MPQIAAQTAANGYYWVEISLGTQVCRCMIDLGLVDSTNQVGFVLEPAVYDSLKQAAMRGFRWRYHRDASGHMTRLESRRCLLSSIERFPSALGVGLAPVDRRIPLG